MWKGENFDPEKYRFEIRLLDQLTTHEAFDYITNNLFFYLRENKLKQLDLLAKRTTLPLWRQSIEEIVALQPVLIHGDIHEDQILIESEDNMKITGILDWETTRIDNPIWEFNFVEWGYGIWKWWESFPEIRRTIWKEYLDRRNISLKTLEGLNLIYTLFEFLTVFKPDSSLATLIGKNQQESAEKCLERLCEITEKLEKEEN